MQQNPAAARANETADAEFLNEMPQQPPVQAGLATGNHGDQGYGEKHRHGIVAARFDFRAGGHPLIQAFAAEQENTAAASVEPTIAPISIP